MIVYDTIEHAYSDVPEREAFLLILSGTHVDVKKDPRLAYWFAKNFIGARWPEAEPCIMEYPKWAFLYARHIIGSRWPEAEPLIMQDHYCWRMYKLEFGSKEVDT